MDWHWSWGTLCGSTGMEIWSPLRRDFGLCFQHLAFHLPGLALMAIISAFYYGRQNGHVLREKLPLLCLRLRSALSFSLALLPAIHMILLINSTEKPIPYIYHLICFAQTISWFCHFLYCIGSIQSLNESTLGVNTVWTLILVFNVMTARTFFSLSTVDTIAVRLGVGFNICYVILQIFYGILLLPNDGTVTATGARGRSDQSHENQPLLSNTSYIRFVDERDPHYIGVAMENSNWLSKLLFSWVNSLMEKGSLGKLQITDDLYDLPETLNCSSISNDFQKAVDKVETRQQDYQIMGDKSLLKALHENFWKEFYGVGILRFIADCSGFAGPIFLNKLVSFIKDKSEEIKWGYVYAAGLTLSTILSSFCDSHYNFHMGLVGLKMRMAVISSIYRKTLSVTSSTLLNKFSIGEIMNFMSTDTDRIVNSCPSFHSLWSIPFQLVVTLYLLYSQVGLVFLAGVAFSIVLIPINKYISNKIGVLSGQLMHEKDNRVKLITEILRGIRVIKLYVWEEHFIRLVNKLRDKELLYLKRRKYLDALCVYFWATTPVIISILTIGIYSAIGNRLTAATVFTCVALLNMLIGPLNAFPWVLNGIIEAWVSLKRIQNFINLPEMVESNFYSNEELDHHHNEEILLKNASFDWGKANESKDESSVTFQLQNINLEIKKGEFIGIVGSIGSGKSTILSALLGEVSITGGDICFSAIETGFGYVSQQPWLQRGTILDNILFGALYDEKKYKSVIFACGLEEDISSLPSGDMTGIGDSGVTLSGGQKSRISLARAVYQNKSVYILDDVLSAVDMRVGKHIFDHCIMGLLKNKTVVLCTHLIQYLVHADKVVLLENGSIKLQGKPAEVFATIDDSLPIDLELGNLTESSSSVAAETVSSPDKLNDGSLNHSKNEADSVLNQETSESGSLHSSVYKAYWKAIGHLLSLSILLSMILMQSSRNMTDWWLSNWVSNGTTANSSANLSILIVNDQIYFNSDSYGNKLYLEVYIGFAVVNTIFTLCRAFLFAYGGVTAATKIHKLLLKSVIKAKVSFFDISPVGRILNRFSSDTYTVDDSLPFILNILLAQFFGLLGSVVVTIYGLPWICTILLPLFPIYHWLQNHYRKTSRELKRLSSTTLSPVYNHFNESLQGLSTIRALRASSRFKRENEDYLEANIKAQFAGQAANRWLGLRLQFIGIALVTGVGIISVIEHQFNTANPGLIGLVISYALSITTSLSGVINAFTETEREMVAVERVKQYIDEIPAESSDSQIDPPFGWPTQGVVCFKNVTLSYREHLLPSLIKLSFETRPAEKIGIVGRTGAGKSSIISALFRLAEVSDGAIYIDSVNVKQISISSLRSRMFCIPQDPFLFSSTIRENLDPLGEFRENEIWNSLLKVNLVETIRKLGGLDIEMSSSGNNFSVGQKQLLCLARALLHSAKVLCIDEATANVDYETDRQIQQTLLSAFKKCTVFTIAHRINTVMHCDRVLVMKKGQLVEFDHPDNLRLDTQSTFYQLLNQK